MIITAARIPPVGMGDLFVVDNGELGITIKAKDRTQMDQITAEWHDGESEKKLAYEDYETLAFFNGKGTEALITWLQSRGSEQDEI